jgi:TRAP-type C4-dicarboxylate transport system permease small subunit
VRRLSALYDRLLSALGLVPGILVALIGAGTCADVFLRNLGSSGLYGMLELVEYSLLILVMAGAGYVMRINRHVTVDILTDVLPRTLTRPVAIATALLSAIFCLIFLWYSVLTVIDTYQSGALVQKTFNIPEWVPIVAIPFGFLFLTIETIRRLILALSSEDTEGTRTRGTGRDGGV